MPSSVVAAVRLYRVLQRHCRTQLPKTSVGVDGGPSESTSTSSGRYVVQPPLDPRQAGSSRITRIPVATRVSLLRWLSHHLDDPAYEQWLEHGLRRQKEEDKEEGAAEDVIVDWVLWTSSETIQDAIRYAFRLGRCSDGSRLEWAIRAYQLLLEQTSLLETFSRREERGLRVAATSQFAGTSSGKFRFAYRVRVENLSSSSEVQLLGRSWIIEAEGEPPSEVIRVHDPLGGAVGQFPVLQRGQAFEYMSGCELATPTGLMKGCFHFRDASDDAQFEVPVEPFRLLSRTAPLAQPTD
jgi:ApaG protein